MSNESGNRLGRLPMTPEGIILNGIKPTRKQMLTANKIVQDYLRLPEDQRSDIARFDWSDLNKPSTLQEIEALRRACLRGGFEAVFRRSSQHFDYDSGRMTNFDVLEVSRRTPTS